MEGEVEKSDSVTKFQAAEAIFSKIDRATKHQNVWRRKGGKEMAKNRIRENVAQQNQNMKVGDISARLGQKKLYDEIACLFESKEQQIYA